MEIKRIEGEIEAILFAMGEAVELPRIARAIRQDPTTTENIIRNMMIRYQEEERGIQIIELENSFQLCTKKEYYDSLIRIAAQPKKPTLTDVMLETLSIIAYKQPVTKAEIEKIRGVKCDHAINKLMDYDLVRELGRLDAPGRPDPPGNHRRISALLWCPGAGRPSGNGSGPAGGFQGGSRGRDPAEAGRITNNTDRCRFTGPVGQIRKQKRSDENAHNIRT